MTRSIVRTVSAAVSLLFVLGSGLEAQGVTSGAINGTVQDSSGTPIVGASVEIRYAPTGFRTVTSTNSRGLYLVQGLEPGSPYSVSARAIGHRSQRSDGIRVFLGQATRHNFALATATVEVEEIVVQTGVDEEIFSPSRQGTATTVGDSALRRLPTLNRDFADFVKLTPQVGVRDGDEGGVAVAGQNNRFNTVQVDGSTVNDRFGIGRTGQTGGQAGGRAVGLDAVKEYQVLLAPYDVRQGNFTGALINAVTKNGTNDLRGTAFFSFRNDAFAGDPLGQSEFSQQQFGASLGGPIMRDRAHFFINGDFSRRTAPAQGPFFGSADRPAPVAQVDFDRFVSLLEGYGLEPGTGDVFDRSNPLSNFLARFDWQLGGSSRLVFRYGYNQAEDDNFSRSTAPNNPIFDLSSVAYAFKNKTHNPSLQFFSNFANGSSNEFRVSFQSIRDRRLPSVVQPLVLVENVTGAVGGPATARLQAGSEQFSQGNELDQDFWEITDNYTMPFGNHLVTIGTRNEFYKVRNLFAQSSYGVWRFDNLDDFEAGIAENFLVSGNTGGGVTGETPFSTYTLGFYLQDQWTVSNRMSVTAGLRADIPMFPDDVEYDPRVITDFGAHEVPSGKFMWQPRVGFNYDLGSASLAQLRGGVGIFAGAPAFVWMSNAYANTGLRFSQLTCAEGNTPAFSPTLPAPLACADGTSITPGGFLGEVDLIGEDTKFPQVLRANLAMDRELGAGIVGTIEGIYTKGINDYFIINRNLDAAVGTDATGRTVYGTFNGSGQSAPNYVNSIYGPSSSGGVYELLNTGNNYAWSLSGQLQKRFAGSMLLTAGYTYSESKDVQSFTSSRAISNWRLAWTPSGDLRNDEATTGSFSRPHRIVIGASYTAPWKSFATDVSLTYVGQSGQPYTYIASGAGGRGDLNADGTNTNDPIYLPTSATDPNLLFADLTTSDGVVTAAQQAAAFDEFVGGESCLDSQRGQIMERNSCKNPWQSFLDMSIRQSLPTISGHALTLEVGVFNVLNLLDSEWGRTKTVGGTVFYTEDPLQQVGFDAGTNLPVFTFDPANVDSRFIPTTALGNSYQVQMGLRYAF
jgi:outer membrane receptor for ferrienterochelin and colicin